MKTGNQTEKNPKPATDPQDPAAVKTPSETETKRELTDDEIVWVAGGGKMSGTKMVEKKQ